MKRIPRTLALAALALGGAAPALRAGQRAADHGTSSNTTAVVSACEMLPAGPGLGLFWPGGPAN